MFATTETVWLLALIYQPIVLIYYICNDEARNPNLLYELERKSHSLRILRPITQIFSLSLFAFIVVVFSKILLMYIYGLEVLRYFLSGLLLTLILSVGYMTSFFADLNGKKLVYFAAFVIGALLTYAFIIPSGLPLGEFYSGEFSELIVPLILPGFIGFIPFILVIILLVILKRMGKADQFVQKISHPFWDKRKAVNRVFGFYFHLIIWGLLVLETILNQSGYTLLSWS